MLRFASDRPTDKKVIPIDAILERTRHTLLRVVREREASLTLTLDDPSPRVCVSAIELEQAVTNIVENALQSKPKGAQVRIDRGATDHQVRITVSDDGCGIDGADLGHVLDPFFTSRLEQGGTGLGLSVAHGIALEHGGGLTLESEPGKGTTVTLTLPREP